MDLHKCQFFDYAPAAVQAIAYSTDGVRVAVARSDADIEIWNVGADWLLEKVRANGQRGAPRGPALGQTCTLTPRACVLWHGHWAASGSRARRT